MISIMCLRIKLNLIIVRKNLKVYDFKEKTKFSLKIRIQFI
jgi:hypothetical protein